MYVLYGLKSAFSLECIIYGLFSILFSLIPTQWT